MCDRYYYINTQFDTRNLENFEETALINLYFLSLKIRRKGMLTLCMLKTPFPGWAKSSAILMFVRLQVTGAGADVSFCDGLGMHRVKTRLLIACGIGCHTIMSG